MYINKAIIVGNLVRDPELRSLPSGQKVCSFSVATNRVWKDTNGARQEAVDYHNVTCFGRTAETVAQWMKKGNQIYVEGRMTTRNWDDKETGKKMYRTEIIAENVQFGPRREGGNSNTNTTTGTDNSSKPEDSLETIDYGESINPDDIPF